MKKLTELRCDDVLVRDAVWIESPVWVFLERIVYLRENTVYPDIIRTQICFGSPHWLYVKESPEEIMEQLYK